MRQAPSPQCRSPIRSSGPGPTAASPPRSTAPGSGARRPRKASASPISSRPTPEPQAAGKADLTDDAAVAEWAGLAVALVPGQRSQPQAHDRGGPGHGGQRVRQLPRGQDVRTGQGFDVHRFTAGDHVWLCGVRIPHTHALEGHSDADVALHALTDALLGAIGDGDIGQHFPDTDQRWKGAASHLFLAEAARARARRAGGASATSTSRSCARPPRSRRTATPCAGASPRSWTSTSPASRVKATTTERLGFTGRREGIAALPRRP